MILQHVRISLLHFQHVFEQRGRSVVWLVVSFINPLIAIMFWKGATANGKEVASGWGFSSFVSYYFLLTIAGAFLMSHTEEDIAVNDIQQGQLSNYLIRPFSFYWKKFYEELPYRVMQGFFGICIFIAFISILNLNIKISNSPYILVLSFFIIIFAYFLCYTFKVILGLLAFWFTDMQGLFTLSEILIILFAGYMMPLELMPKTWYQISQILPFASMIYDPVIAIQGKLLPMELLVLLGKQFLWIGIFIGLYRIIWNQGIKKFTALGQ